MNVNMENDTCQGQFDWSGELTAVPGFGFMPTCVEREMEKRFQVRSRFPHVMNLMSMC